MCVFMFFAGGQKIADRFARHAFVISLNPCAKKQRLGKNYDLFIMKCLFLRYLTSLNVLK